MATLKTKCTRCGRTSYRSVRGTTAFDPTTYIDTSYGCDECCNSGGLELKAQKAVNGLTTPFKALGNLFRW